MRIRKGVEERENVRCDGREKVEKEAKKGLGESEVAEG